MSTPLLLVVDDQAGIRDLIQQVGEDAGFEVMTAADGAAFERLYAACEPSIISLDLHMPDTDGVELLRFLALQHCRAGIFVTTGFDARVASTVQDLGQTLGLNMAGILQKPFSVADLRRVLDEALCSDPTVRAEDLSDAIDAHQLAVYYQPKANLTGAGPWTIDGVEALVRWPHPRHGLLLPGKFIALAEETGLVAPLTEFVLVTVIDQIKAWQTRGLNLTVAVNYAPQLLHDLQLPDRLSHLLEIKGVQAASLMLEITEGSATPHTTQTKDILSRFRLKGIGLSIDDFGTGYSSLVDLYRLPYGEVKIDRSFVRDLDNARKADEAKVIVRSIIDLANNLGLEVCAEGVESETALEYLRSLGCDRAQGYHIARPLPPDQLYEMVTRSSPTRRQSPDNARAPAEAATKTLAPAADR